MKASMAVPTKQLPRLPLLVDDYLTDFPKVREFFNGDFRELDAFRRQAERVRPRRIPREDLAAVLREQNKNYGCGSQTLDQIEKIVRDEACAVVTGQQVGLFSGPLYTIYKALTAVKLSEYLNRNCPGSHVPIFWLASDDHDLAEIDHIALVDKENKIEEIRCRMPSFESKIPASNLILPPEINDGIQQLKDLTLDSEFKAEIIDDLSEAYRSGRSFAEAFARWMTRLFKSHGLIFIDASHPRLRELGSDVYYQEIAEESPSTHKAIATSQKLRQTGYGVQIPLHEGTLNIFYTERERRTIQWKGGAFEIKGMAPMIKKEELLALAKEKPFLFSPNVLLRPIYQDALLPTVAYIGGPGEIAYFAQMKGVYEGFHLPMPVIYPRKSVTIVEKKIDHILKKYDLKIPDIWRDADGLFGKITKERIPGSLQESLSLVLGHVEQDMDSLKKEILAIEPTLGDSIDLAKGRMNQQLKFLEKKILQAAKKRNETTMRQLHKAVLNLYPHQQLQERVFNIVPYLIKYGYAFMDKLDKAVDIEEYGHQILSMG
jgi:bacillithiol biosynthesis cysteine-adding enzyme BshC